MIDNPTQNPKIYIFGAASTAARLLNTIKGKYNIIAVLDNDKSKWGGDFEGYPIMAPDDIIGSDYDKIVIASLPGLDMIKAQLLGMHVDATKIDTSYVWLSVKSRIVFLEQLSLLIYEKRINGCVAEGGVFQGEFAKEINRVFPDKKLFLFDTFEGFNTKDIVIEQSRQYSDFRAGHLDITSLDLVMSKLPNPEKTVICKGYFPDTTEGINETFCFVNLDFDLYSPILAGLEYFFPRMEKGGVILVHDYFSEGFKGVKAAVSEFESKLGYSLNLFPIGDGISVGIYC